MADKKAHIIRLTTESNGVENMLLEEGASDSAELTHKTFAILQAAMAAIAELAIQDGMLKKGK